MSPRGSALVVALALLLASCSCPGPEVDGGVPDSGQDGGRDAGLVDSGTPDAGAPDAGSDAGFDAGEPDAGLDGGPQDAGPRDAGTPPDAGVLRCVGVACVGDTLCSLDDGECRCGGATACAAGQTCECPAGMPGCAPDERVCTTSTRCDAVLCGGGATCDLFDGRCKCDGAGGPVCGDLQQCVTLSRPSQCVGGCMMLCQNGLSCDPDDGECKCGGRGGTPCGSGEVCVSVPTQYTCRLACAPVGGQCPVGQACVIDTRPSRDVAYCAFLSALRFEGEQCSGPTQCAFGHCAGLSSAAPFGVCRDACDPQGPQPRCPTGRHCEGLPDVADAGFCVP